MKLKLGETLYRGRCPACNGRQLRRRANSLIYCYSCGEASIAPADVLDEKGEKFRNLHKPATRDRPRLAGSGIVAGPCYRRGFRWGAKGLA